VGDILFSYSITFLFFYYFYHAQPQTPKGAYYIQLIAISKAYLDNLKILSLLAIEVLYIYRVLISLLVAPFRELGVKISYLKENNIQ